MKPSRLLAVAQTPAGERMTLSTHSGRYTVRVEGHVLMCSSAHHSEERMAEIACRGPDARVLVAGLGLGYTLRAALDRLGPAGRVVVAELMPAVVAWNRGPLADVAGRPLDDPRVRVVAGDVVELLAAAPEPFDGILLDVDNGPEAFTVDSNERLYGHDGLRLLRAALRPGGSVVVWSAFPSRAFPGRLRSAGFDARSVQVRARGDRGPRHWLYVGERRESRAARSRRGGGAA